VSPIADAPIVKALRRLFPALSVAVLALGVVAVIASAGSTLGYDFLAYRTAAERLRHGLALYDPAVDLAGGFGIFLYPPPFALGVLPFAFIDAALGTWVWIGALIVSFLVGVAILPVRLEVRYGIILLGGLDWPFLYAVKLGQVGPLLFLLFAIGWRWIDRPGALGLSAAAGAIVKVQPGLVVLWAAATGRWRAAAIAVGALLAAAAIATVVVGLGAWGDYVALLRRVSTPVTTPHNFTPGAVAYQLGLAQGAAEALQLLVIAVSVLACAYAARRAPPAASYLVVVVASQLLSPLLWDHYAMLLLLPVAYLLDRGVWAAALVPLATSLPLVPITPAWMYPVVFLVMLVAPILVTGRRPVHPVARATIPEVGAILRP
jgi:alpha-1,2-mannosyltransferase